MASVILHAFLMAPLIWGGHHQLRRTPNTQGSSAGQHETPSGESMVVVFTEDSSAMRDPSDDEDTPKNRFFLPQTPIVPITPSHVSAAFVDLADLPDDIESTEANGDRTGHAVLFGRYMGQISARVERAWMRPRSIPASGSFKCRVQIAQDRLGNIQEVTLQRCTDDPRWRVSLMHAIDSASPLPAPPDPAVFSNLLTMEFESDPYMAGASEDGFEPPASRTLGPGAAPNPPRKNGVVTRRMRPDGSMDLTISGSASPESETSRVAPR